MKKRDTVSLAVLALLVSCNPRINQNTEASKVGAVSGTQLVESDSQRANLINGGQLQEIDKEDFLREHGDMLVLSGVTDKNRLTTVTSYNEAFVKVANRKFNCGWEERSASIDEGMEDKISYKYGRREINVKTKGCTPHVQNQSVNFFDHFKNDSVKSRTVRTLCQSDYSSLETVSKIQDNIYKIYCKYNLKSLNIKNFEVTLDLSRNVDEKIISSYLETGYSDVMNSSMSRYKYEQISDESVKEIIEKSRNSKQRSHSVVEIAQKVGKQFYNDWTLNNAIMKLDRDQMFQTVVYLHSEECGDVKSYTDAIVIDVNEDKLVRYAVQEKELDEDCKPMKSSLGKHEVRQDYEKDLIESALRHNFMLLHRSNLLHELSKSSVIGVGGDFSYDTFKHPISAFSEENYPQD